VDLLALLARARRHKPSRLAHCLHRSAEAIQRRGLVILFSDLIPAEDEEADAVIDGLVHLKYMGHDVVVFHILDHAELTFPFDGPTRFVDTESLQIVTADPHAVASGYREEVKQFVEDYRDRCRRAEIDFVDVDTADSFDRVLVAYLHARQARF
jgi:hypothetical protein